MADAKAILKTSGRWLARAGRHAGKAMADAYHAIDPDVVRHAAQTPLLSYSLFVSRKEQIAALPDDGHPPVIFVHGLGGNRGNFLLMGWYFRLHGRRRSYKIHFDGGQNLEDMGRALSEFIAQVCEVTGAPSVDVVAHSMGGIIARVALLDAATQTRVGSLVTLGSPHKGTYPARYANTHATRMLRPDSELIARINAKPLPEHLRVTAFFSHNDVFILPAESAIIDGHPSVDMTPFTHYSYLIDPKSWAAVWQALAQPAAVTQPAH